MKNKRGKRCLGILLTLALVLSLLPTGLLPTGQLVQTAWAADDVTYDSEASHFGFELKAGADKTSGTDDDYLSASRYTGSATAVEIPNTVTVSALVSMGVLTSEDQSTYTDAGITELPVKEVGARFSSYSTSGITHIRLNANIEVIGYIAFAYMDALVDVDLSSDSKLTTINQYAFRDNGELTRVGMTVDDTKTDKLPATLNSIDSYAFYHTGKLNSIDLSATKVTDLPECTFTESGIASAKLPDTLTGTGWNVFKSCQNLTSLTFPAGITYFGPYSLEGCTSLTELVLKCGASGIGENTDGSYAALRGVSESCTVWVPRPADKTSYEATVKQVYGQMAASASVKLRWLDPSSFSKLSTSPLTTPSATSSSVVQLKDSSGNVVGSFTYDYNDSNSDGLGGIITISGRNSDQKLVINANNASNKTLVTWNVSRAYEQRRGTDVSGYGVLRGDELVEAMGRTQSLGNPTENKTECALGLTNIQEYGIYFYYPTLVNRNTSYTSGGRPQSARALPPVMVIYQPTNDLTGVQLSSGAVSNVSIDSGKYSCYLTIGRQVLVPGFDALMPYNQDFVSGVTEAKNGSASITYQWYKTDTRTNSGGTPVGSGTAVFSAFDRAGGDGIYWRCGGLSEAYIQNLAASGAGSHYFYLQVTVNTGTASSTYTSEPYVLNLYKQMSVSLVCDASEAASASNITYNTTTQKYDILKNTTNVLFTPVVTNLPENFDGYVTYQWSGTNLSQTYTTNYLLTDWLDYTKTGTQTVTCRVSLYSAEGVLLTSASSPVKFNVSSTDATTFPYTPEFNTGKQGQTQYLQKDASGHVLLTVYLNNECGVLENGSGERKINNGTKFDVCLAPSPTSNRDGDRIAKEITSVITADGAFSDTGSDMTIGGISFDVFTGTFQIDITDALATYWSNNGKSAFAGHGVTYFYIKAYNKTTTTNYGVAYSPVFAVIPTADLVGDTTALSPRNVTVTEQPFETVWAKADTTANITVGLKTGNVPLTGSVRTSGEDVPVIYWEYQGRVSGKWETLVLQKGITCTYKETCTSDGGAYTQDGTVTLSIPMNATAMGPIMQQDTTIKLRLRADTEAFYGSTSNPKTLVEVTLVPVASGSLPMIISGRESGGREYLKWNSSASAYELVAASDYTVIPKNEYWLYSDRYDGKTAENFGNKPGSTEDVMLWATAVTNPNVTVWQVELPNGTKKILAAGDELVYDSGDASSDGTWPAYANKITVAYDQSTTVKTSLTIDPPTGGKAFVLKVTPIAVVLKDSSGSAAATANWSAAKADQTYTIRVNPVISATAPSVYGYGTYYFNLANFDPYTITASVYPADEGVVTCQWYYRSNSDRKEPETDTPVGPAIIVTEDTQVELELTEDILKLFAADGGSGTYTGTGCFYLYANNFNAAATETKNAQSTSGFYTVNVGSYLVTERPEIVTQAAAFEDTVYYCEPVHNDGMYSVTVKAPTANMKQTVRMEYTIYAPNSSRVISSSYSNIGTATANSGGTITTSPYDGARYSVTNNGDGTVTYTITNKKTSAYPLGSQVNDGGTYRTDFDVELRWFVENQLQVEDGNYATGGKTGTQRGNTYTIHQRQVEQPGMSSVTLDKNAALTEGYTISDAAVAAGVGVSVGDSVPAFTQSSNIGGSLRPFTATLSLDEDSRAGASLWLGLEYYDTTENAWKSANDRLYLPRSDGTYGDAGSVTLRKYDGEDSEVGYLMSPGTAAPALNDRGSTGEDEKYHYDYNDGDGALILRLTLTALYGDGDAYYDYYTESASGVVYSQPFALVRVSGEPVNADEPVYQGSVDSFYGFTWNRDDSTVTSHSFGEDRWVIGGTGAGVLSYQWQRYSKATSSYVNITDNATANTPVLTASKKEMAAWAADTPFLNSAGRPVVNLWLWVTNTNNAPSITGSRTATASKSTQCVFASTAATPAASATVNKATATAGDDSLNVAVSVTGQGGDDLNLSNVTYQWQYRVVSATPLGGTAYANPDDAWRDVSSATGSTYSIPTSNSSVDLLVPYDNGGKPGTTWYQVNGSSLWKYYKSVTVEYRCAVTNTEGTESVTGWSNTVTVTLNAPSFVLTVSGKYNDGTTEDPLRVTEDRTVTLSVPEQEGFTYLWVRYASMETEYYGDLPGTVTANAAGLTIKAGDYSTSYPYYVCRITHTASGITRETARVYVGRENTDGSAMKPVVTTGSNSLDCDVGGATKESFSVTATAPDGGALSYQWQENQNGTWTDLPGQTAASLALTGLDSAPCYRTFRCVVTNTKDESTAKDDSTRFYLTVRGVVLEDVNFAPVAGQEFTTTLTATVYGLPGESIAWAITSADFGYTVTKVETTVPTGSSVATVTATLHSDDPKTATLNVTATVGSTYEDPCSVTLNVVDFTIDTDKVPCTLDEAMTPFTIETTGTRPTSGWSWTGDIPDGLSISDSGVISGTPTIPGAYPVTLKAGTAVKACTIIVQSPAADKIAGDSGYLTIGDKDTGLKDDLSGTGWSWSGEAGVLTLDSSYPGGKIYLYSNNATPLYIRMKGNVTVESTISCGNSAAGLYLYGSGSLTVTSPAEENNGIYLGPDGTLYDRRAAGDLTVTNSYTGSSNSHAVYGNIDGAGSVGTVTVTNTAYGSAERSYGVYGNVTCAGSNPVSITATIADSGTTAWGVQGNLTQNGSGAVTVTVSSTANSEGAASAYSRGVNGTLTQNGSGAVTVTVNQNAGQAAGVYGAEYVVLNSSGKVTITADGHGCATYVGGTRNLTTGGSVSAELTGRNGTGDTVGANSITLGHTGGSVTLNAAGSADIVRAVYNLPADATGYIVSGAPLSGTVTYTAATNDSPIFTVNGVKIEKDAEGNYVYPLLLQQGETMTPLAVTAYCAGGCTLEYDSNYPNGLTVKKEKNIITYSGAPGSNKTNTGSFQITATTTGETPQTATLTVNWTMSDLKLLSGPSLYRFDTTGNCQVRAGEENQSIYFYAVGEKPARLQVFDGETKLYEQTGAYSSQIYSVDNGATWYPSDNVYCYHYEGFDASGMAVDGTKTLTVKALDGSDHELQSLSVTVTAVDPACPDYVTVGSGRGYYNLGLYNYEGAGWKWKKDPLQLNLNGYNGSEYSAIYSDGAPLKLFVQQSSSVAAIYAYAGLNITGNSGYKLTVNNTNTDRAALTLNGNTLTVDTNGSVYITSAGKVLDGVSSFKLGKSVQTLRMEGTFANALTTDWLTTAPASYYLYNGSTGATAESPVEGVFLYGKGTTPPDFTVTVTGDTSATVGGTATLTANLPMEITEATKNGTAEKAFEITWQWAKSTDGGATWGDIAGETGSTLNPSTATAGVTQYRCTAKVNGTSKTSDPVTLTVAPAGVTVSGGSGSHGDSGHTPGVQAHSSKSEWLTGTGTETTVTLTDKATDTKVADQNTTNVSAADGVSHEDYSFDTIPDGSYTITIEKPHFAPVEKEVEISGGDVEVPTVDLYMWGDVSKDGMYSAKDTLIAKRLVAGTVSPDDDYHKAIADVSEDGELTAKDTLMIKRIVAGTTSK